MKKTGLIGLGIKSPLRFYLVASLLHGLFTSKVGLGKFLLSFFIITLKSYFSIKNHHKKWWYEMIYLSFALLSLFFVWFSTCFCCLSFSIPANLLANLFTTKTSFFRQNITIVIASITKTNI